MKNSKKLFILIESVLAVLVIIVAILMVQEKNGRALYKVSVIIQNSDDNQWSAFKYGLKMAAEDQGIEMYVVNTGEELSVEDEKRIIESEIDNGADAVIVQPVPDAEEMLEKIRSKIPVMLVECSASEERTSAGIPVTAPDNYAMGVTLAEELLKDYEGKINDKKIGLLSKTDDSEVVADRERGFKDALMDAGAQISWSISEASFTEDREAFLEDQPRVDYVIALDDDSLTRAGECAAANNLHGALVYGIGYSTEAVYYLDTGVVECLVVPDGFNVGYQSLTEVAENLEKYFGKLQNREVSYMIIRRDTLFTKENQEVLFTMSQ